jgi:hypothetical protein
MEVADIPISSSEDISVNPNSHTHIANIEFVCRYFVIYEGKFIYFINSK